MFGTRWSQKPPVGTQIDWGHPWATGLVAFWAFQEGTGAPFELISRSLPSFSNGFSWDAASRAASFNGSSTDLRYGIPAVGPAISLAGVATAANAASNGVLIERSSANATWSVLLDSTTSSLAWRGGSSGNRNAIANSKLANNAPFAWCFTDPGTTDGPPPNGTAAYLNGGLQAPVGTGTAQRAVSNTNVVHLGNSDNSTSFLAGRQNYIVIWNYAIPAAQAIAIGSNLNAIFQIFQPLRSVMWSFAQSASQGSAAITAGNDSLSAPGRLTALAQFATTASDDRLAGSGAVTAQGLIGGPPAPMRSSVLGCLRPQPLSR